jgi:two-component system chemotaxis response regulator CheY
MHGDESRSSAEPWLRYAREKRMGLVLVIDDEPALREVARQFLEEAGHTVVEAGDGKVGLWIFRELRPDLAIVDLFMPEKEGVETIREMRAVDPAAKIVAMSGGGRFGTRQLLDGLVDLGATATLAKPFGHAELLKAVNCAMNGPPGRKEQPSRDYCCTI